MKDEKLMDDYSSWIEACKHGLQLFNLDHFFIKYGS
ncbi:hypothetical protein AHMF7616_03812 [Adhaeribacter pallidiroseus]|uniref:Uncharacterized protein n=1 Tax=Adhaeribacter pallidiroseus TaxID=2072847 RepID=A0A369QLD3_9BACT|nr:hypothetical protein AHMF7616_03812 [Adhaeribacter pallidiroseus]